MEEAVLTEGFHAFGLPFRAASSRFQLPFIKEADVTQPQLISSNYRKS